MTTSSNKVPFVGKKFHYDYGALVYEVTVKSENTLHWECIKGEYLGSHDEEKYNSFYINDQMLFISWKEKTGLSVGQILDFSNNKVFTYLYTSDGIIPLSGTIKEAS